MNQDIKKLYDELINPSNGLNEDEFLEKLGKFEDYTKINIFRTLLANNDKETVRNSKEYRAIKSLNPYSIEQVKEDNKIRNRLERKAINSLVGENVSIKDILNIYSKNINSVLKQTDIDIKAKLEELNIVCDKVDGVILPPEGEERIITGSGKGVEKKNGFDRFSLLFKKILNTDNGFFTGDYRVIIGKNRNNMMRKDSYIVIEIPKINKTIFVNNGYGEATFIYNGIPTDAEIQEKGKLSYKNEFERIIFSNPDQWVEEVKKGLFNQKEGEVNKFKDIDAKKLKDYLSREEFIQGAKEYFENNPKEKEIRLSADSTKKRNNLYLVINGKTYTTNSISSRIFKEMGSQNAKNYFIAWNGYIEVIKLIFGEDDEGVKKLIPILKSRSKKDNMTREEFIQGAKEYFANNPKEKEIWLSTYNARERRNIKIVINGKTYTIMKIAGQIFRGMRSEKAKDYLMSGEGYIKVIKLIFGEEDEEVKKFIPILKSKSVKDNMTREEFIQRAKEYFENNPEEKKLWLSAYTARERRNIKIIINGKTYTRSSIASRIFKEMDAGVAGSYFPTTGGYIQALKIIFGEDDEEVKKLITILKSKSYKDNMDREVFIQGAKEYFKNHPEEKKVWLSADTAIKRKNIKIVINGKTYTDKTIGYRIFKEMGSHKACYYLSSSEGYIQALKLIFGEEDEEVKNLISILRSKSFKDDMTKEEFMQGVKEYFENNPKEKESWLSADTELKRKSVKIVINGKTYTKNSIASRIFKEMGSQNAHHYFSTGEGYIEAIKLIFGEEDEEVKKLISILKSKSYKDNITREEFIQGAKEYFENNPKEKEIWLNADTAKKRKKIKIVINGKNYANYSIGPRIFKEIMADKAGDYFISGEGYIEALKLIFGEDDPSVANLENKIKQNLKFGRKK